MKTLKYLLFFNLILGFNYSSQLFASDIDDSLIIDQLGNLDISETNNLESFDEYDSDSEDELGYEYNSAPFDFSEDAISESKDCCVLFRGIYFSPDDYDKKQRSYYRRHSQTAEPLYALADYDEAELDLSEDQRRELFEYADQIRSVVKLLSAKERALFFSYYKNSHAKFLKQTKNPRRSDFREPYKTLYDAFKSFPSFSNKKLIVSTSELSEKSLKYGSGEYVSVDGKIKLDPQYDANGRPHHPYLGKIYVMVVADSDVDDLGLYFAMYEHANDPTTRFKWLNIYDREIMVPGCMPAQNVVYSENIRMPNFSGRYSMYYQQKYGISRNKFEAVQSELKTRYSDSEYIKKLIERVVTYQSQRLDALIKTECASRGINVVYKGLDGSFKSSLPSLDSIRAKRKEINK